MLNKRETAAFCSQLKLLLTAGMPLLEALTVIKGLPQNKKRRLEVKAVVEQLNSGRSLSEAASGLLPGLACGSLAAAERSGNLEENLGRLAAHYAGKADLDEKLAGALVYPVFVLCLSLISVLVLIVFVIPGMRELLAGLETELPPLTSFVLGLSDAWPVLICLPLILIAGAVHFKRKDPAAVEKLFFRAPFLCQLYRQELVIQTCGTLGALLKGGTPIIEAVGIAGNSLASPSMKRALAEAGEGLANGEKLSGVLARHRQFPASVVQMLEIGENTGQLDQMLTEIARFQAGEREALLKRCVSLIEPGLTLAVGLLVGVVVLALFLPLVNLVSSLQ